MRINYPLLTIFLLSASYMFAQYPASLHQNDLRVWLKANTYDGEHTNLGYSQARIEMFSYVDEVGGKIHCVYTNYEQDAAAVTFPNPMNTEHLVPQSYFGSQEPMRSDIHVLRPSHQSPNSSRANYPLGEVPDALAKWHGIDGFGDYISTFIEPTPNDDFSEGIIGLWEPQEDKKGDIARQIFYFFTMYPTQAGTIDTVADIAMLYEWHVNDPVDALEAQRNNRIEQQQGNRNPYIDYATLAYDAWLWEESDICAAFETAPVDLTKSFQPVPYPNGVIDRVQVKFYKQSPQIPYAAADSAACDIQFWPIRDLVLNVPIVNGDTSLLPERVKPGQHFFKWPLKFQRPDIEPNIRYEWRVRCACNEGAGTLSPWSDIKIFNTPDFDPVTNIYTPPGIEKPSDGPNAKNLQTEDFTVYPNPCHGLLNIQNESLGSEWGIQDLSGRIVKSGMISGTRETLDISDLRPGIYLLRISDSNLVKIQILN